MNGVGPSRRSIGGGALGIALAVAGLLAGCEVVVLEPDLDRGIDRGPPPPLLGDGGLVDVTPAEDPAPRDASLPPEPLFMPAEVRVGDVEPYSTVQRSVSLMAGREPLEIETVGVGGLGFALDQRSPRAPLSLQPGEVVRWTIEYTPEIAGRPSVGHLIVVTDQGIRRVPLAGRGAWSGPACATWDAEADPAPPELIEPGTSLLLKAKPPATVALGDVGLSWTLLQSPLGADRVPLERFADPELPQAGGPPDDPVSFAAVLHADKPGRYLFEATPLLPLEADCSPEPTVVAVHACPCPERPLHIRIGWRRSAQAPFGVPSIRPHLISGSEVAWADGLSLDAPAVDWGRAGPLDDALLDAVAGDTSGRLDAWIEEGHLPPLLRLGLAVFNVPGSPRTAVDITVEVHLGAQLVETLHIDGIEAGRSFWDLAAVVREADSTRLIVYDRVLSAEDDELPDPNMPLALGAACDPWFGPVCGPRTRCRPSPEGNRCRR